ncbi:MAG: alpha/beta hydrolase domain-containing protein [Acidimicrobiales bacterium]|nr:alpha/beta hydrolase domain-containing protein [Acidimicrobiales bacterium]
MNLRRQAALLAILSIVGAGCGESENGGLVATTTSPTITTESTVPLDDQPENDGTQPAREVSPSAAVPTLADPLPEPAPEQMLANYPLDRVGYSMSEFVISGTATSYTSAAPLSADGRWPVTPEATAPYSTRAVVVQPVDPEQFSGTVIVEWFNVTSGLDAAVDWQYTHDEIIREGHAYVGVSAQAVGVEQLTMSEPERYGTLAHPGDSFSYDIYSQVGMAVRELSDMLLPGLEPTTLIAAGQSQSALRLTTYVNAVAPLTNVFDGFLIHSRGGVAAALSEEPQVDMATSAPVIIRDDLAVPVFILQTETDVLGVMEFLPARQPDSDYVRLWEVAGTAHVDIYVAQQAGDDDGSMGSDVAQFESLSNPVAGFTVDLGGSPLTLDCPPALNAGQLHYVVLSALHHIVSWATTGDAPPSMPLLDVDESTSPASFVLDANGNATGGVRTPAVDAPVATLSGLPAPDAPGFCVFFGSTVPFTPEQLDARYPNPGDFAAEWQRAVGDAEAAGALLPSDAARLAEMVPLPE